MGSGLNPTHNKDTAVVENLDPIVQALLATGFTWGVTALGAASVFFTREINRKLLDSLLGFAGGVMIAASFWSLLAPAIELAEESGIQPWFPPVVGFLLGGGFLRTIDMILPHLHFGAPMSEAEGVPTTWRRAPRVSRSCSGACR